MLDFQLSLPTRIIFGPGRVKELGNVVNLAGKSAFILMDSDASLRAPHLVKQVVALLEEAGVRSECFEKIHINPADKEIKKAAAMARKAGSDFLVGLGGGSVQDAAKAVALTVPNRHGLWRAKADGAISWLKQPRPALPVISVPTTAGSGSEANPWMTMRVDGEAGMICWSTDSTYPRLALIDPDLTAPLSPYVTAWTGMSAFFRAVASYLSTSRQPISDLLSLEAVSLIADALPRAVQHGASEDRQTLCWAGTAAGICASLAQCVSHHALEFALGARVPEMPHGVALSIIGPAYFTYVAGLKPNRFDDLAFAMGADVDAMPKDKRPFAFIKRLRELLEEVGLGQVSLRDFGMERSDLAPVARRASRLLTSLPASAPVRLSEADLLNILENAFA